MGKFYGNYFISSNTDYRGICVYELANGNEIGCIHHPGVDFRDTSQLIYGNICIVPNRIDNLNPTLIGIDVDRVIAGETNFENAVVFEVDAGTPSVLSINTYENKIILGGYFNYLRILEI